MKRPRTNSGLNLLIVFGILLATVGIMLHFWRPERYERIDMIPIVVGFILAFFGALWKDPERAAYAGEKITSAGASVVESFVKLRTGKGPNAPVVEVTKTKPVDDPTAEPTVEVKVTTPGVPSTDPATPLEPGAGGPDGLRD